MILYSALQHSNMETAI